MSDSKGKLCHFLVGVVLALFLGGCISTTSGPPQSKPDQEEAADLLYQLGARYYRNGQYDLARDRLLTSIDKNPRNAIAYSTLALTYEKLDNIRLATDAYESALRIAPNDFSVLNTYAVFLCRYGNYDDAQKYFERAIGIRENDDAEIDADQCRRLHVGEAGSGAGRNITSAQHWIIGRPTAKRYCT